MAFPPNYRQDRNNIERAKQRKAQEKQRKREEKSAQRKGGQQTAEESPQPDAKSKDQN